MKKLVIVLVAIVGMLFLSGCGQSPNLYKRGTKVIKVEGRHYVVPTSSYSTWKRISKKSARYTNKMTSNILKCRTGDLYVTSEKDTESNIYKSAITSGSQKMKKMVRTKGRKLTGEEISSILSNYTKQEATKIAKEGKHRCVHPQPWSWTKQRNRYEAEQRRINNDPRVIAARIQANATYEAARAQRAQAKAQQEIADQYSYNSLNNNYKFSF